MYWLLTCPVLKIPYHGSCNIYIEIPYVKLCSILKIPPYGSSDICIDTLHGVMMKKKFIINYVPVV